MSELVALDWDCLDLDASPPELILPGSIQKGNKRDAYFDLNRETARQLRRYQNRVWKETPAMCPSRQSNRMSKTSARRTRSQLGRFVMHGYLRNLVIEIDRALEIHLADFRCIVGQVGCELPASHPKTEPPGVQVRYLSQLVLLSVAIPLCFRVPACRFTTSLATFLGVGVGVRNLLATE